MKLCRSSLYVTPYHVSWQFSTRTLPSPSFMSAFATDGRKYSHFIGFFGTFSSSHAGKRFISSSIIECENAQQFIDTGSSPESGSQFSPSSV